MVKTFRGCFAKHEGVLGDFHVFQDEILTNFHNISTL